MAIKHTSKTSNLFSDLHTLCSSLSFVFLLASIFNLGLLLIYIAGNVCCSASIYIIREDEQMDESTCQSAENIATLPNIFKMCNCEDRMPRTSDNNYHSFSAYHLCNWTDHSYFMDTTQDKYIGINISLWYVVYFLFLYSVDEKSKADVAISFIKPRVEQNTLTNSLQSTKPLTK